MQLPVILMCAFWWCTKCNANIIAKEIRASLRSAGQVYDAGGVIRGNLKGIFSAFLF